STSADTDARMSAKILTWSRSHGVFAGLSIGGATLREDLDVNQELYGKRLSNREIANSNIKAPAAAQPLISELNKYSHAKIADAKSSALEPLDAARGKRATQ